MVYDCILFYNELDILEIRLNELNDVVDQFVIAEATKTHTNKDKPLYYNENKKRFKKFHHKIKHMVIDDSPDVISPWIIESYQFSALEKAIKNCNPEDVILHGPVDEIPRAEKISEWKNKKGKLKTFLFKLSMFYLDMVEVDPKGRPGTVMFKYKYLAGFRDIYYTRYQRADVEIRNGGWHLSYIGGIKKVKEKLNAFTHQEFNNQKYNTTEKLKLAIAKKKDPFGLGRRFNIVPIRELPLYVQNNPDKFQNLMTSSLGKKD